MGNEVSAEEKQEKKILRSPNVGEASDLYWASGEGNIDAVRKILTTTSFNDLNRLELNGSTALHAASYFGRANVVRLLLEERGVMRHRKNRYGRTAYEEAGNDEIRQLFHRPNNNRFYSDSTGNNEDIFHFTNDSSPEEDDEAYNKWIEMFDNDVEIRAERFRARISEILYSSPRLLSILSRITGEPLLGTEDETIDPLRKLIDASITSTHPQYDKACDLVSKYTKNEKSGTSVTSLHSRDAIVS